MSGSKEAVILTVIGLGFAVFLSFNGTSFFSAIGLAPNEALAARAQERCEAFVSEQISSASDVRTQDLWRRSGAVVVNVAYRRASDITGFTLRLCVYDERAGTVLLPSVFEQQSWRRRW